MPFPLVERVIYKNNPLINVICQFRFPPILKIDSDTPANFQEEIRNKFPMYIEKRELVQQIASPTDAPIIVNQLLSKQSSGKNHEFLSENGLCKVNLTRTFITLSTSKYERWEVFLQSFIEVLDAFIKTYSPPFFTRIGLRYVDIFDRSKLGLAHSNWCDLIKPEFIGLLSSTFSNKIDNYESAYDIRLDDDKSFVRMVISLAKEQVTNEDCFMVDSDFYNALKKRKEEALENLDFLHNRASRLIRYIITEKLHLAMKPERI